MKFLNKALLIGVALSSISGVAVAGGGSKAEAGAGSQAAMSEKGNLPSFSEVDKDNNTFVDAQEAAAANIEIGAVDTNYDGRLDKTEWERAAGKVPGPDAEAKTPAGKSEKSQ